MLEASFTNSTINQIILSIINTINAFTIFQLTTALNTVINQFFLMFYLCMTADNYQAAISHCLSG